jgi:hypothetical protein
MKRTSGSGPLPNAATKYRTRTYLISDDDPASAQSLSCPNWLEELKRREPTN